MAYLYVKALHILGFVTWFGSLYFLVRLMIEHRRTQGSSDDGSWVNHLSKMEVSTYRFICNPAMMLTWIFGIAMIALQPELMKQGWLHIKLTLVVLLTIYHLVVKRRMIALNSSEKPISIGSLQWLNAISVLLLIAIVMVAVYRNGINYLAIGVTLLAVFLVYFMKLRSPRTS